MSVEHVLDKLCAHNAPVLGGIAMHNGQIYDNFPDLYELVDRTELIDHASNIFELTEGLEIEGPQFEQLFLEFQAHSVFAVRLEGGVLLLLNNPIERAAFKKIQVGVNLFLKPLQRALVEEKSIPKQAVASALDAMEPTAAQTPDEKPKPKPKRRMFRGVEY